MIAAKEFHIREIIRRGSNKNPSGWRRNKRAKTSVRKLWNANSNGFGCRRKVATQNRKPELTITKNSSPKNRKKRSETLELYIPPGERLGDTVIEAHGVSKAYDNKLLFENLEFSLPRGGIVGVIGPNGAGKTTLFRLITEQDSADAGDFKVGETVKLGYVDQSRDSLNGDKTIFDEITDGHDVVQLGKREMNSRAYVSRFNFSGSDQQKKVGMLSGGERNRVHLAKMLKSGANVILLDEPTNDLDVNTMRALEEALENFGGCAVVISHDRWFLDRIATHIFSV